MVSLPFRLYWQLSDPTVWITIISHNPPLCATCTPNIFTNKQLNLCSEITTAKQAPKPTLLKTRTTHMKFPLLHGAVRLFNSTPLPFICAWHFVPNLIEHLLGGQLMSVIKQTLRRGKEMSNQRKEFTLSECDSKSWVEGSPSAREHGALKDAYFNRASVTVLSPLLLVPGQRSTSWEHF